MKPPHTPHRAAAPHFLQVEVKGRKVTRAMVIVVVVVETEGMTGRASGDVFVGCLGLKRVERVFLWISLV